MHSKTRGNIAKVKLLNLAYLTNILILNTSWRKRSLHCARYCKIVFNLDIKSADKVHSIVENVSRTLVKTNVSRLVSEVIYTIHEAYIYGTFKNIHLSEK